MSGRLYRAVGSVHGRHHWWWVSLAPGTERVSSKPQRQRSEKGLQGYTGVNIPGLPRHEGPTGGQGLAGLLCTVLFSGSKIFHLSTPYQLRQENVIRFGGHTQTSQTLRYPSSLLLSVSTCSQRPVKQEKVLSDCARAFSYAPESPCSDGGAFRMLRDWILE